MLGLCGNCCRARPEGVCGPNVHNQRFTARGCEGKKRREFSTKSWLEADALQKLFLDDARCQHYGLSTNMNRNHCRNLIVIGLRLLASNPEMDLNDQRVPEIVQIILPPHVFEDVIDKLRKMKITETAASSSDQPGAHAADPAVMVISSDSEPAAAAFEGLVGHSASENFSEQFGEAKFLSTAAIWMAIGSGKQPFKLENAVDPQHCTCLVPAYNPGNMSGLDADGKPCAHYRASTPSKEPLVKIPRMFGPDHRLTAHQVGERILEKWFEARPELRQRLYRPIEQPFLWHAATEPGLACTSMHDVGKWYYFKLKRPVPGFPEGTQLHMPRPTLGGKVFEEMVHSCSMYTLANCVFNGVLPGPVKGKGGRLGVYAFKRKSAKATAIKSSGYCVYQSLCNCDCGIFFGPRLCLEVQSWRSWELGSKMSMGDGQMCLQPDSFHFVGFYVHVITRDDLDIWEAGADSGNLWFACGKWDPQYEMSPDCVAVH